MNARHLEKPQGPASFIGVAAPAEPISRSPAVAHETLPRQAAESATAAVAPDYGSEAFTHVPAWMPRPASAVSASAKDASLRSDGFVEGTLRYLFRADQADALGEITTHLEAAGMIADADGAAYSSESPMRRCEIRVESAPDDGMLVSLSYQGIDHEKGCTCPTCGGPAETPEP